MKMKMLCAAAVLVFAAACGGGDGSDLPAGQHDLGDDISVVVREVRDPVPDSGFDGHVVAVDLEYFNHGDDPAQMNAAFRVELHDSTGRNGEMVAVPELSPHGSVLAPHSSARGWEAFRIGDDATPVELALWGLQSGADAVPVVIDL